MNRLILNAFVIALIAHTLPGCAHKNGSDQGNQTANNHSQTKEYYTCPMHPSVMSDHPGVCPICHMTLVKVISGGPVSAGSVRTESVYLAPSRQVLANIPTMTAVPKQLEKEISVVGIIDYAEPNAQQITARFAGASSGLQSPMLDSA